MPVGVCRLKIYIPSSGSLKEKRKILKSIKDRVRHNFNVSIAEVEDMDKLQVSLIEIAFVSNDRKFINEVLSKTIDLVNNMRAIDIVDCSIEIY